MHVVWCGVVVWCVVLWCTMVCCVVVWCGVLWCVVLCRCISSGNSNSIPQVPETLSPVAQDFLLACLTRDPDHRPDALSLLQHPWICEPLGDADLTSAGRSPIASRSPSAPAVNSYASNPTPHRTDPDGRGPFRPSVRPSSRSPTLSASASASGGRLARRTGSEFVTRPLLRPPSHAHSQSSVVSMPPGLRSNQPQPQPSPSHFVPSGLAADPSSSDEEWQHEEPHYDYDDLQRDRHRRNRGRESSDAGDATAAALAHSQSQLGGGGGGGGGRSVMRSASEEISRRSPHRSSRHTHVLSAPVPMPTPLRPAHRGDREVSGAEREEFGDAYSKYEKYERERGVRPPRPLRSRLRQRTQECAGGRIRPALAVGDALAGDRGERRPHRPRP